MTKGDALSGKPYAGNPHVRFDEGKSAQAATSRRGALLYKFVKILFAVLAISTTGLAEAQQTLASWRMAIATNGYVAVERKSKVSQDVRQTIWKCYREHIGYEGVQMSTPKLVSTNEFGAVYDLPFTMSNGARCNFGVVLFFGGDARPYYCTTEGSASENVDDLALSVLSSGMVSNNVVTTIRQVLDMSNTDIAPSIGKYSICIPFKRFYLYVSDDMPMAEWTHPVRYLFVDEGMTTFAVVYGNVPLAVSVDGADEQFVLVGGNTGERKVSRNLLKSTSLLSADKSGDAFPSVLDGNSSNCYALLVSGGYNTANNHCRYWNEICFVYNVLQKRFRLPRANIKVLWAGGDPSKDLCRNGTCTSSYPCRGYSFETVNLSDFDLDGNNDINGSATLANVRSALTAYAKNLQAKDQLLIFFSDHGGTYGGGVNGKATVCLWGGELTDSELALLTKDIKCPVMVALKTCYSGGMIQEFVNSSANRTIATADRYDPSLAYPMMGDWTYYFFSALCGYYPVGAPTTTSGLNPRTCGETCDADLDGDGRVSFYEAHQFAYKMNPHIGEDIPQYDESPQSANLGKKLFLTQYADAPAVVVKEKVLTPTLSPASGSLGYAPATVTAACGTFGATIRYTLDGSEPSGKSTVYSGGITLTSDAMVSIRAFKSGMEASDVVSIAYTVSRSAPEKALITSVSQGDSSSGIVVNWSGGSGTESYDLLRSESSSMSSAATIAGGLAASTSSYADLTAKPGKTYYYQIRSRNKHGTTLSAASQGAYLMLNPPDGVTATVTSTKIGSATIRVDWNAAMGASYYRVYRKTSDGTLTTLGSWQSSRTFTDNVPLSGAITQVSYYVRSSAYSHGSNPSGYSREAAVTITSSPDDWQLMLNYPWHSTTDLGAICHRPGTSREYSCRLQYADGTFEQSGFVTSPSWRVKSGQGITLTSANGSYNGWSYRPPTVSVAVSATAPEQTAIITASFTTSGGVTVTRDFTLFVTTVGVPKSISVSSPGFATPGETIQLGIKTSYYGDRNWDDEPWEEPEATWTVIGGNGATVTEDGELTAWPVTAKTSVTVQACVNTLSGVLTAVETLNVSPAVITKQVAVIPPLGGESTNFVGKIDTTTYCECDFAGWITGLAYHGSKTTNPVDSTGNISLGRGKNSVGLIGCYMFLSLKADRNPGKDRETTFKLRWDGGGIDFTVIQREAPYANAPVVSGGANGTITANSTTDGSVLHYATDGEEPSENSPVLSNRLDFNESTEFAVKAFGDWMQASDTVYADIVGKDSQWDDIEISFVPGQAGLAAPAKRAYKVNETFGELPSYPKTNGLYFKGWTLHKGSDKLVSATDSVPSQSATLYAVWSPVAEDKPSWVALPWNFKSTMTATMKVYDDITGMYLDPAMCIIGIEDEDGVCRGSSENGFGDIQSELNGKNGLYVFGVYSQIESGKETGLKVRIWNRQKGFMVVSNDSFVFSADGVVGNEAQPFVVHVISGFRVGFDANGGVVGETSRVVVENTVVGELPVPVRVGYAFLGWFTAENGGTRITATTKLTGNVTCYARWVYDGSAAVSAVVAEECKGMGKVSGGKRAKIGGKLTLAAAASKGYVFSGWYLNDVLVSRNAKCSVKVEDDATYLAKFISSAEDKAGIALDVGDRRLDVDNISAEADAMVGVALKIPVSSDCLSASSVKVTGLPKGLTYDTKKKCVTGVPSKAGTTVAKFEVTTAGKAKKTFKLTFNAVALPEWAKGQFSGYAATADGESVSENFSVSVGSTGKISGKFKLGGTNWTFSASSFATNSAIHGATNLVCAVNAKATVKVGKKNKSFTCPMGFTLVPDSDTSEIASHTEDGFFGEGGFFAERLPGIRITKTAGGTVSMDKSYGQVASGKSVKFTAKPSKGYAFCGWYDEGGNLVSQSLTYKVTMENCDRFYFAEFKKESELARPELDWGGSTDIMVGVAYETKPSVAAEAAVKIVSVTGLPKGLSWKSGKVKGVPTAAKTYTVTVKVALGTNAKKTWSYKIPMTAVALPEWAKGQFSGEAIAAYGESVSENFSMSVGSTGKISGKFKLCGTNWTFSATSFTTNSVIHGATNLVCAVNAKATVKVGKKNRTFTCPMGFTLVPDSNISEIASHTEDGFFGEGGFFAERVPGIRITKTSGGTVSMDKSYGQVACGKSVKFTAKPSKGYAFAGWYDEDDNLVSQALNYSLKMEDADRFFFARFVTAAEDKSSLVVSDIEEMWTETDGSFQLALGEYITSLSLPKVTVSGLPPGLKFTSKRLKIDEGICDFEPLVIEANSIYGNATKPGAYTVKVSVSNASVSEKKAIVRKFKINVPNLTAANGYFVDGLNNGVGDKYSLSIGISNIDDFLPSLKLNAGTAKLAVSGLPSGLKYDAANGRITGIATKAGTYTITLTVTDGKAKYVSTITIEVEALPDWVVGTFETYHYIIGESTQSYYTWDFNRHCTLTINANGRFSGKGESAEGVGTVQNGTLITKDDDGSYLFYLRNEMSNEWNYWDFTIRREVIDGVVCGVITGRDYGEDEADEPGDLGDPYDGDIWGIQNTWKIAKNSKLTPDLVKDTITYVDMSNMEDRYFDGWLGGGYPYGGYLTLKYGANGAVTTAYSATKGGKATATGSAQLVPYEVDGNITKAWLYIALKPKGRDPFGVLLFLSIDTSNGNVYGDDVMVDDYLLEVE